MPLHKCFPHEFSTGALWKTLFFEYVDFTGFQRFKIISPQKLSTGFVDYSQLIHTQSFSEKITFSKTPFRFAYCIFLRISILYCKCGEADAGGWYTERSASQNGMLLTDYFEAVFVKNNSRQGMNFRWKFNHFMRFRAFRSDIWSPAHIYDTARRSHTEIAQL